MHRDLKPANILLQRREGAPWPGVVKVTDFGLAKILDSEVAMTRVGSRMGTLPYMAPEQFSGSKDLDARADVFALGMMLWRMLAGCLPVDPEDMVAVTRLYTGERPMPRISDVAPGVDPSFSALASAALAVDPSARIADARAFLHALDDAAARLLPAPPARPAPHPVAIPLPTAVPTAASSGPLPSAASVPPTVFTAQSSMNSRGPVFTAVIAIVGLAAVGAMAFLAGRGNRSVEADHGGTPVPSVAATAPRSETPREPLRRPSEPTSTALAVAEEEAKRTVGGGDFPAACQEYADKMLKCLESDKYPDAAKDGARQGIEAMKSVWEFRDMEGAAKDAAINAANDACTQSVNAMRQSGEMMCPGVW